MEHAPVGLDGKPAEHDVPDDLAILNCDERRNHSSASPPPVHKLRFDISLERLTVDLSNRIVVVRDFFTDEGHSYSSTVLFSAPHLLSCFVTKYERVKEHHNFVFKK